MATCTNGIKGKLKEEVLAFTARGRERGWSIIRKGNFKSDLNEIKKLLVYRIKSIKITNDKLKNGDARVVQNRRST
jgi:hypothetical protein